jgi:uncharacterized membrane protein YdjX (TVP38/TMEM64 family)
MKGQSTVRALVKSGAVLVLVTGGILAVHLTGLDEYVDFEEIKLRADSLRDVAREHYGTSVAVFIAVYILATLALPSAAVLTLLSGFLYGTLLGAAYVNVGVTVGATLGFLISRYVLGRWLQKKYSHRISAINAEIREHGRFYLLSIRFFPFFPFFAKNFLIGLTRVSIRDFAWTTCIGSLPGTLVFTYMGRQFAFLESVRDMLSPGVVFAFVLLVVMAFSPVAIRLVVGRRRRKRAQETE